MAFARQARKSVEFSNQRVFVTGASSGIGRACAQAFARRGARLLLAARSADRLSEVLGELPAGDHHAVACDLTRAEDRDRACDEAVERFGGVDVLVNSAGVGLYAPTLEISSEQARYLFELNFFAPLELCRRLAPQIPRGGAVVNISSIGGKVALPWLGLYSASKFALNGLSDALRMELAPRGVHVLCFCPGHVKTPFRDNVLGGSIPAAVERQERFHLTPEQCADQVLRGLERRQGEILTPWITRALALASFFLPGVVQRRMQQMHSA